MLTCIILLPLDVYIKYFLQKYALQLGSITFKIKNYGKDINNRTRWRSFRPLSLEVFAYIRYIGKYKNMKVTVQSGSFHVIQSDFIVHIYKSIILKCQIINITVNRVLICYN